MDKVLEQESRQLQAQIAAYYRNNKGPKQAPFVGRFMKPVNAPMTSGFGVRMHPILKYKRMHTGIDLGASYGTTIMASAAGTVMSAQTMRGYGNCVIIDHGGGISTLYGHCSAILVSAGQKVTQGQAVGKVGSTGLSTGPHLHFEIRVNGVPINPLRKM